MEIPSSEISHLKLTLTQRNIKAELLLMASSLHVQAVLKKDAEGLGKMADALGPHT